MTNPTELTAEVLRDTYHVETYGDIHRVSVVKTDGGSGQVSRSGLEVMQERIKDIFSNSLAPVCHNMLLHFQSFIDCGVINYDPAKRDEARRRPRERLNHLEVKRSLLGPFEFSISLGTAVDAPERVPLSLESARNAMTERPIQGTGRLPDTVLLGSGIEEQNLLDEYIKMMEHTVDNLSTAKVGEACRMLETEALGLDRICGGGILELVLSAGRFFIARTALSDAERIQQEFVNGCSQCRAAGEPFGQLTRTQERPLSEVRELRSSEATRPIRIAKQYVMQHFDEPIILETVCEDIGFSVNYFSMLFKRETGEGFAKHLTRVRIEEAKTSLHETSIPIAEIRKKVGHSDRKYFTHTFHKATGLSPVEYRKLYGQREQEGGREVEQNRSRYLSVRVIALSTTVLCLVMFQTAACLVQVLWGNASLWPGVMGAALLLICIRVFSKWILRPYPRLEWTMHLFLEGYIITDLTDPCQLVLTPMAYRILEHTMKIMDSSELLKLNKRQAQYLAPQNQINPHFLYSILESIRSEALIAGLTSVADMTEVLATFFRYTISKVENLAPVEEKLENCRTYFRIQQYWFGLRLSLSIECDPEDREEIYGYRLPKLIMQPILENSTIHGTECKIGIGYLSIHLERSGQRLLIRTSDNGVGTDEEVSSRMNDRLGKGGQAFASQGSETRGGIALINVNNRIHLLFGEEYGPHVFSMPGVGADVETNLPAITDDRDLKSKEVLK